MTISTIVTMITGFIPIFILAIQGLEFRVQGLEFRVQDLEFIV